LPLRTDKGEKGGGERNSIAGPGSGYNYESNYEGEFTKEANLPANL